MVQFVFRPSADVYRTVYREASQKPLPGSLLTLPFSNFVHHLSSPDICLTQTTFKITECTHAHSQTHIHICFHTSYKESSRTQPQLECMSWCACLCLCVSVCDVRLYVCSGGVVSLSISLSFLSTLWAASDQHMCENRPQHTYMYVNELRTHKKYELPYGNNFHNDKIRIRIY